MPKCNYCGETLEEYMTSCPYCDSPLLEEEISQDDILTRYKSTLIANRYKILSRLGIGGMGGGLQGFRPGVK